MLSMLTVVVVVSQPATKHSSDPNVLVPFPHPVITEVLYAVPTGPEGDANADGVRSATGDEFIELINPHDKPIRLKGYVLTDGKNLRAAKRPASKNPAKPGAPHTKPEKPAKTPSPPGAGEPVAGDDDARIRFVFPDIELKPGQVVVVFNGYRGEGDTPAGEPKPEPPKDENGPIRLSMDMRSPFVALANTGDCVLLTDPAGEPVECVSWGAKTKPPEDVAPLMETAPQAKGSVVRVGLTRGFVSHMDRFGALFSPGTHEAHPPQSSPAPGKGGETGKH